MRFELYWHFIYCVCVCERERERESYLWNVSKKEENKGKGKKSAKLLPDDSRLWTSEQSNKQPLSPIDFKFQIFKILVWIKQTRSSLSSLTATLPLPTPFLTQPQELLENKVHCHSSSVPLPPQVSLFFFFFSCR